MPWLACSPLGVFVFMVRNYTSVIIKRFPTETHSCSNNKNVGNGNVECSKICILYKYLKANDNYG